jgi:alkylation response protein AidB-like acyl-CoA dehydrogenase
MSQHASKGLDIESRQMVVETVRQLRKKLLSKQQILEWDKHEIFPEAVIREMLGAEIGLQLLFIPEEYGGMGGGAIDCCAVTREVAKICLGVGTAFFAIQLGSDPILVGATAEQKAKWLGAIASGGSLVAYAVTEPGAGSNLAALKTKAEPVMGDGGKVVGYKITGNKQFISNGGYADIITVLADTPQGPSFFVVEKGMPGLEQHKGEEKHGIRASNTSPLTLTDVYVPAENLIGLEPGKGMKQANQVFGYTRLMVASMALGAGDAAMDIVVPYAKERIQFNTPLSEKQGYTHKLVVPNIVRLAAAATYIEEVARMLDSSDDDLQVEGAIGKYFATEAADRAANDAIQALGGYGYIREFEVEKIKRDVKITCIYEGTSEIQQNIISTFRWKSSRKSKGQFYGGIAQSLTQIAEEMPDVGAQYCALAAKALNQVIDLAHEQRLTRQQAVMFALADVMTIVEVGAAFCRRAAQLAGARDAEGEKYKAMARIFAGEVCRVTAENSFAVWMAQENIDPQKADTFMAAIGYREMLVSRGNWMTDMDRVADSVFGR